MSEATMTTQGEEYIVSTTASRTYDVMSIKKNNTTPKK
jgi:hypothetical protein